MLKRSATALASLLGVVLLESTALGQSTTQRECAAAYEAAQVDIHASPPRLLHARTELLVCMRDRCAPFMRTDCSGWLADVEKRTPTIVLEAARSDGGSLPDVRVLVDGKVLRDKLDGAEIRIDPGPHTFVFETTGFPSVTKAEVVGVGDKLKHVQATFLVPTAGRGNARAQDDKKHEPPESAEPRWVDRAVPYFLVAAGLGLAGFTIFGLRGNSLKSDLDSCKGACSDRAVDNALYSYIAADACLVVSLTAIGFVGYSLLTRPPSGSAASGSFRQDLRF